MTTFIFLIYLAGVVNGLTGSIIILLIASAIGALFATMFFVIEKDTMPPFWKQFIGGYVGLLFLMALIPSERTVYTIAALYATKEVAQTEVAQKAYTLLGKKLDEALGEQQ